MTNGDPGPSSQKAITKRASEDADHGKTKKPRTVKTKTEQRSCDHWPQYFHSALNTVLAFITSRKQLATTFPSIRSSVENVTKQPLDMSQVAELKALLPEIITFAYVPRNQIQVNSTAKSSKDEPDFSAFSRDPSKETDHVLLLEFAESWKGTTGGTSENLLPATRTLAATKKLIEKRNDRFIKAVNELLAAVSSTDDPVSLLQAAAREHIPIDPAHLKDNPSINETAHMPIPTSEDRASIDDILIELQEQQWYKDQIVERRTVDAREGQTGNLDPPLSPSIQKALQSSRNITSLYSHQANAISALASGKDVIVSTSTASGKSVIYQVPLLMLLEKDPHATAIFVYPTKALAQDQRTAMENLLNSCPNLEHMQVSTYDGDTPNEKRAVKTLITKSKDMIHAAILSHEELWRSSRNFLVSDTHTLQLFVVDELHYYSGTFGSHVAQIMRRLRRVCAAIGNNHTRFVSCSATIANPLAHMVNIFGLDSSQIQVVTEDGAPTGMKEYLIWRSPYVDEHQPALGRQSSIAEATALMRFLMKRGIRAMKTLRTELSGEGRLDILERVQAYRGARAASKKYLQERRQIEHDAFTGHLLGLIATNALELGVDIGALDAVLMLGFPVTLASFRQQAGRAGRRKRDSLAVFIAEGLPIDQYYLNNPKELFDKDTDDLIIDLDNQIIIEAHLQCAAHEMPICLEDEKYFGPSLKEICKLKLHRDEDGWYHPDNKYLPSPSKHISIHVSNSVTSAKILEEIEISRAIFEVYEGGVFIHQGKPFIVQEIHHDTKLVKLIQADVNWITKQRDVNALQTYRIREIKATPQRAFYGRVEVFCQHRHNVILDVVDVDSTPWIHETVGMWIDVPDFVLQLLRDKFIKPAAAIHSAEHAFLNRFPLASDIRTECKAEEKEYLKKESRRMRPARLIMYDPIGHRNGIAAKAFEHVSDILHKARSTVENCECEQGCAKCVLSPSCKEGNIVSSKAGALAILKAILNTEINPDDIPFETDERALHGHDSIISVSPVHTRTAQCISVESDNST
ncbi:DEAD/H helicase [Lentinula raphanica]|uniref:DEAD/H helicase n=1 Tax=Lentinula raphanica TaxID=153919 RepID=A0AA38UB63_9AGAR|nr:DEAD/H helicase [Lentinula raphanica]